MVTFFDDLPDLILLEILSYLSCADALWTFNTLNNRLTMLLVERGINRHVNLSSTQYNQFEKLLPLLRLNEIDSLIIDCYASALQLRKWPYLSNLKKLQIKGVYNYFDICHFVMQHANTLTHLIIESSMYHLRLGLTNQDYSVLWSLETFEDFLKKILRRLPALCLLSFGMESTFFLSCWDLETIRTPLTYLRITCMSIVTIIRLMLAQPLRHTLQQFHVKLNDKFSDTHIDISHTKLLSRMEALHTFTFVKSLKWHFMEEWTFLDMLTSSRVLPILRRMTFSIVINAADLNHMNHSDLFTDYRHVNIHYAFIFDDNRPHDELRKLVSYGSQSHPREIASATFTSECWPDSQTYITPGKKYEKKPKNRQHLFYTLPWSFNEFQLCVPDRCISELQVFTSFSLEIKTFSSRLRKLHISDNILTSASLPFYVISSNEIVELCISRCDRQVSFNLPMVSHLILIDSLDALNARSLLTNIRSIQIVFHHECLDFAIDDWTSLHTLSNLPLLNSVRIVLYNMLSPPNDSSCITIAEAALKMTDFGFCFRHFRYHYVEHDYDINLIFKKHCLFIECLRNLIVAMSVNKQQYIVVDEDGSGIFVWF